MNASFNVITIIVVILGVWLFGLSLVFYLILSHYKRLTKVEGGDLKKVLDKVLKIQEDNKKEIQALAANLERVREDGNLHIQKVGMVRFNPFSETGGDQSFSLAVLDRYDTGFVITWLHARDGTRAYGKWVEKGKSQYELSREEKIAVEAARKGSS